MDLVLKSAAIAANLPSTSGRPVGRAAVYSSLSIITAARQEQQPGEEYFDPELWDPRSRSVDTLPAFRRTITRAGLEAVVVPLVCSSVVAARAWATPLSLVLIDGGHAGETVRADYLNWSDHLIPGGYLLFHDVFTDPARGGQAPFAAYRQARDDGRFDELSMTETLGVLKRKGGSNK